ncbi:MAG: helix-hairpin-helix domain-containing protein [bacterium]|nr:helix-hairpin-helix domain-containing protein [bacterium]
MDNRFRLIVTCITLLLYLIALYPTQAILILALSAVGFFAYLAIKRYNNSTNGKRRNKSRIERRQAALRAARMFLAPYNSNMIWKNLTLTNKFCSIRINNTEEIVVMEKRQVEGQAYRKFVVYMSELYDNDELFNLFCVDFNYNKHYDDIVNDCRRYRVSIIENKIDGTGNISENTLSNKQIAANQTISDDISDKTDINNASEIELTALPGISIVLSKRIIKKREEIDGFKSINDFFSFLNLKPHMEKQLRDKVFVTKMNGKVQNKYTKERQVDL